MKYTSLYTGPDGKSRFREIELAEVNYAPAYVKSGKPIARQTASLHSTGIFFREWLPQESYDWHTAPRRQYVIVTEGGQDITAGDGTKRRFGPGQNFLVEDLTGGGHLTELADKKTARSIFVPIE